jgi:uncharacterized membrane protein
MKRQSLDPRAASLTAVMIAVVYVLTRLVQIPIGTQGFVHLGDAAIYFAAFAFGPWVAAVAGGLGTALVDATTGYAQWAVFSLLIHGSQGFVAGLITQRVPGLRGQLMAVISGGLIVIAGYFLAGILLTGVGQAISGILPNILQALSGGIVGIPLFSAVLRAYPPLAHWRAAGHWSE